jgi:hypothetical protein
MPEGLSAGEVGKEIAEHRERAQAAVEDQGTEPDRHDRWLSVLEAVLLSLVAVLAAYSGYAAAKWGTRSSVELARASALRTKANRFDTEAIVTRTLDSVSFNAWFTAFVSGNRRAQQLAVKRFRPGYRPAFDAWIATDPAHNPHAPPGPSYMPQYVIPQETQARHADARADAAFTDGQDAGETSDKYIRDTVFLATVLFLVGISGHFRIRQARWALIIVGVALLAFAVIQLLGLPEPP